MRTITFSIILFALAAPLLANQDLYRVQVLGNGTAIVSNASGQVAHIGPEIFMEGWKYFPVHVWLRNPKFDGMIFLPGGVQIGVSSSVTFSASTLYFHYHLTPLKDAVVIRASAAVYLNYKDWLGAPYQVGPITGIIPTEVQKDFTITQSNSGFASLGAVQSQGLHLQLEDKGLMTTLEDLRSLRPSLAFILDHKEPIKPWVWKAGEEKDLDFTLTFNRDFTGPIPPSPGPSKDLTGDWWGRLESYHGTRPERLSLRFEKDKRGHYQGTVRDFDLSLGGTDAVLDHLSWKKGELNGQIEAGSFDLRLNSQGVVLQGTLQSNKSKSVVPLYFSRGLNYLLPRVDSHGLAVTQYSYRLPESTVDDWPVGDIRQSSLDLQFLTTGIDGILDQRIPNVEGLVVVQGGKLVLDEYFRGLGPADAHQLLSASKSVLSILFGIAQDHAWVNANDRLFDYFPQYRTNDWTDKKDKILLKHLLSMTSGIACDDWVPETNCQQGMFGSSDWLDFVLSLPINHKAGEHWAYCNDCMELLGAAIAQKSGMSVPEFAQKYLFGPLAIQDIDWGDAGPHQVTEVCGSLKLRPRDMAKLGQLYLRKGKWNGRQIVSGNWVDASIRPQAPNPPEDPRYFEYGYLWWQEQMPYRDGTTSVFYANGRGGQLIFVAPALDLVCVMTGANYNDYSLEEDFFKAYILGAIK